MSNEQNVAGKPLPPTYFLVALVLVVPLHFIIPLKQVIVMPWRLVGVLPLVAGAAVTLIADQVFKREDTTVKPFEESNVLVTSGVFAITRNPMYVGMTGILLGVSLLLGSVTPFIVTAVLAVLLDRYFITPEEALLEQTFGESYRDYRNRVRRWV